MSETLGQAMLGYAKAVDIHQQKVLGRIPDIRPRHDRVLIRRIEEQKGPITLTDADKSLKGEVLAVGPGKRDEDGEIQPLQVKPGDVVLFSSKWNDLAGDHYSDLPVGTDPMIHLVQEADILGIL